MRDAPSPPTNPFRQVGRMHDLFIHRPVFLAQLRELLPAGRSVVLVGPEGTGKSRLIRYLFKRYFDGREFLPHVLAVVYDPSSADDDLSLLRAFHLRLKKEIGRRGLDWGEIPWLETFVDLPSVFRDFDRLFDALLEEGLTPILVIEPLDVGALRFGHTLQWLAGRLERGVQLLTAARTLDALPPFLADRLVPIEVSSFTAEEAEAFLTRPLEGHPAPFTPDERAALFASSGGHPACLHQAAAEAMAARAAVPAGSPASVAIPARADAPAERRDAAERP
jgi:hypothetical protein